VASSSKVKLPVHKIAGSRRSSNSHTTKSKGKAKAAMPETKRGRPSGSVNFTETDIEALLDAIVEVQPQGDRGWDKVTAIYNDKAHMEHRQLRTHKTLLSKFKQASSSIVSLDGF
jgi:hypothetical protein